MFRIGVFARLGQVSVRTLRFYDERGLIKPARIDTQTGYRYYQADQISRLRHILSLRDLGFSLEEIAETLPVANVPEAMTAFLTRKRDEVQERLEKDREILTRLESRLHQLHEERKQKMNSYDVTIKRVPPVLAAAIYEKIPDWESVTPTFNRIFDEVYAYAGAQNATFAGAAFDLWYDEEMKDTDMLVAACAPVMAPLPETDRVKMVTLPEVETMAFVVHKGGFDEELGKAHQAVIQWISENGYRIAGPGRELYQVYDREGDPEKWETELQYPVVKA